MALSERGLRSVLESLKVGCEIGDMRSVMSERLIAGGAGRACSERVGYQPFTRTGGSSMADSVYRVTEVIGVSTESWEAAARSAVETAAKTVRDLRIAEVVRQDVTIEDGQLKNYRVRLAVSFKYDSGD
ncbi:MAG: dodecin family protein [Solirubrobacteraceae bacterium]